MYVTLYDCIVLIMIATLKYQLLNSKLAVLVLRIALSFLAHRLDSLGSNTRVDTFFTRSVYCSTYMVTWKASTLKRQEGFVSTVNYLFYKFVRLLYKTRKKFDDHSV